MITCSHLSSDWIIGCRGNHSQFYGLTNGDVIGETTPKFQNGKISTPNDLTTTFNGNWQNFLINLKLKGFKQTKVKLDTLNEFWSNLKCTISIFINILISL